MYLYQADDRTAEILKLNTRIKDFEKAEQARIKQLDKEKLQREKEFSKQIENEKKRFEKDLDNERKAHLKALNKLQTQVNSLQHLNVSRLTVLLLLLM